MKRILAEIGFIAAGYGFFQEAMDIFAFIEEENKENVSLVTLGRIIALAQVGKQGSLRKIVVSKGGNCSSFNDFFLNFISLLEKEKQRKLSLDKENFKVKRLEEIAKVLLRMIQRGKNENTTNIIE